MIEINAAQAPPIPLNRLTISGIAVIITFFAANIPTTPPISKAPNIHPKLCKCAPVSTFWYKKIVPIIAADIPDAAIKFPFRAEAGLESIFNPIINVTDAKR